MIATWEKHEGQAVDGIPLLRLLGSTDASAVYLAEIDGRRCALKIVPADGIAAPALLARWRQASELSHPHLTRLFRWGTARLQSRPVAYVAMEYAEEVLADVGRPLTPKEARDMLAPTVAALAYLHAQGMGHGCVKPSNVLSAGDVLKISGDAPGRIGERPPPERTPSPYDPPELQTSGATAAGDVWSLGIALVEALTKELPLTETTPPRMPESPDELRPIIEGCLQRDPALRWTMEDIGHWLRHGTPLRKPALKSSKSRYWAPASVGAAAVVVIGAIAFEHRAAPPAPSIPVAPKAAEPFPVPPTPPPVQTNPAPPADVPKPRQPAAASGLAAVVVAGIHPVLPDVPDKARLTIHGKVRVSARVETDSTGVVTSATPQSGTSKYFVDLALKAARQWRFAPGGARAWTIRFVFTRDEDHPVSAQAAPAP